MTESTVAAAVVDSADVAPAATSAPSGRALRAGAIRNAAWNWLGVGTEVCVAILLTPFLIHRLGDAAYGTWIVIGSLAGYLANLDFGLRSSVGRYVAFYHARQDRDGTLRIVNTAAATLAALGLVGFGAVSLAATRLEVWTDVPTDIRSDAYTALLILGINLALGLVLRVFDATLWGFQRFDLLNIVDIPLAGLRAASAAIVVSRGFGLVGLAWVTLSLTIAAGTAKALLSHHVDRSLRPSFGFIRFTALREMWVYGMWNSLMSITSMMRTQLSPLAIGSVLGVTWVTPFSLVMRLVGTATILIAAGAGVLTPIATAFHAQDDHGRQRRLLLESGRYSAAAALYFFTLFAILGRALLSIWIGPNLEWAWLPLVIVAAGELLPMSVVVAENTALGMAQNRVLAARGAGECLTSLVLAVVLAHFYGFTGVCVGLAISATCWRGCFLLRQALYLTDLTLVDYLRFSIGPALVAALPPACLLALGVSYLPPVGWSSLCTLGIGFTLIYGLSYALCQVALRHAISSATGASRAKSVPQA